MAYDLRRAALIGCCALAIVVAASLFPAAGYGDYPGSEAVDSDYYERGGDGAGVPAPDDTETDTETATETETGTETGTETETETETETQTETETTTETETETPVGSSSSGSSGSSIPGVLVVLALGGFGAVFFWYVTDPTRSSDVSEVDLPSGFVPRLRLRFSRIPQLTMAATIGASRIVPSLLDGVTRTTRGIGSGLGLVARDVGRGFGTALIAIPSTLGTVGSGLFSGLFSSGGLSSLFGRPSLPSWRSRSSNRSSSSPFTADSDPESEPEPEPDHGPPTVEEAWESMIEDLPVRRRRSRTPGEYARTAIDFGLPRRAVLRLTEAFRDIRYGGFPPSPDRTRRARDAFEEIERARASDGEDGDEEPTGGDDR
ncbi:DUF4129 domain-containing protein [Halomontanus rarus]|uniref:DUF4129 domain-containing protein n=1 Tax=Halomontanus rarus TaxID=3034020 RepID=UPI001A987B96